MNEIYTFLGQLNAMGWVLIIGVVVFSYVMYRMNIAPDDFQIKDLIRHSVTGKADIYKFGQLICLLISSWMIVYLILNNRLTEFYYSMYMLAWAGSTAINKWLGMKAGNSGSNSTTEESK